MGSSRRNDPDTIRHRLLEGILLRLAKHPDASRFVLRGGMLLRHWFRPTVRIAADLDLASTLSYSVEETSKRFIPMLADRNVDDSVVFDSKRFRVEGIWLNTEFPGVRIFACGSADGRESEFSMDVTYGEPLVPPPEPGDYTTLCPGLSARVWMCRPETIVGRKLHALWHMGMMHWRAKDLNDLRLLFENMPIDDGLLSEAIALSYTSRGERASDACTVFGPNSWWTMKTSTAKWRDFVKEAKREKPPSDLSSVVALLSARLNPVLESLR